MRLRLPLAATAATLLLAAPATAADPINGAKYEGTTDTHSPFSFEVVDGKVTNLVTSAPLTCVGGSFATKIAAIVSKTPFPVSGGQITGKDETADPRLEMKDASFTSPTEAKGTLNAFTTEWNGPGAVPAFTSCNRDITWTAKTSAAPPAAAPTTSAPAPTIAPPAVTGPTIAPPIAQLGALRSAKLARTISVPIVAPAAVTGQLLLGARDAKRYGVPRVIGRGTAAAGATRLTLRQSASTLKKLRRARRLKATVRLQAAGGPAATKSLTLGR